MRTKTLLLTAALGAAGLATSMAQTVYSVNAVGYVNLALPVGFSIISNPLNNANNNVTNLFASAPEGTTIYKYNGATYATTILDFGDWSNKGITVVPGEAIFIKIPPGSAYTNTFVGDVMSGNLTNSIPTGFSLRSSQVPQAGLLGTDLKYTPAEGDTVYQFNPAAQNYLPARIFDFGAWNTEPNLKVGEGFFIKNSTTGTRLWTRQFSIGN
jgi:hypothetical protein